MFIKFFFFEDVILILFGLVFCLKVIGIILMLDDYRFFVEFLMLLIVLLDFLFVIRIKIFFVLGWGENLKRFFIVISVCIIFDFGLLIVELCIMSFSCLLLIG